MRTGRYYRHVQRPHGEDGLSALTCVIDMWVHGSYVGNGPCSSCESPVARL
jgi:hypothetical protein